MRHWYTGLGAEKLVRLFYRARYNGEPCFIKLVTNDSSIKKEIFINEYATQCNLDFIPKLLQSNDINKNSSFLVTEFISGAKKFQMPNDEKSFETICANFIYIHDCLKKYDIIHGDISISNIILDSQNRIKLIDFGVGKAPGSEVFDTGRFIHRGTYYIPTNDSRIYDNAFSFLKVMDAAGIPTAFKQKKCYKEIESLVGEHTYTVMSRHGGSQ